MTHVTIIIYKNRNYRKIFFSELPHEMKNSEEICVFKVKFF